jgi:uncharacterized protein YecT (DUF1311 family)
MILAGLMVIGAGPSVAGPDMECTGSSQVEIGDCVVDTLERVDAVIEQAYGFAMDAALELDSITGRVVAVPALEAGQAAWSAYRDAHCAFVGETFGGGSGTGIGIGSCRIVLGRGRVETLLRYAQ